MGMRIISSGKPFFFEKWRAVFIFLSLVCIALPSFASTSWEVAIIFLGSQEASDYQKDIDRNILEIVRLNPSESFHISLYREFRERSVSYFAHEVSPQSTPWDELFYSIDLKGVDLFGKLESTPRGQKTPNLILDDNRLRDFFSRAFQNDTGHRLLIIYSHGFGAKGLKGVPLITLRQNLEQYLPKRSGAKPIDVLWMNSCYMASLEVAYEVRGIADYMMASEDAEFSSGKPFNELKSLEDGPEDVLQTVHSLGEKYIQSYSIVEKGSQHKQVYSSAATMSLIDLNKLPPLIKALSVMVKKATPLTDEHKKSLRDSHAYRQMTGQKKLVDLGLTLMALYKNKLSSPQLKKVSHALLMFLDLLEESKLKTTPRLELMPPQENSLLVYGYNGWERGYEGDEEILPFIPNNLKTAEYMEGPQGKKWPVKPIQKKLTVIPFSPLFKEFNYLYVDAETKLPIGDEEALIQIRDVTFFTASHSKNPILWMGYTQGLLNFAERYTGLNVMDPFSDAAGLDYLDTQFNQRTGWASF